MVLVTAPEPRRPEVRLVDPGPWPAASAGAPPSRPSLLVPAAVLLVLLVVVTSVRGQQRDENRLRQTTVRASIGTIVLDSALHLDLEVVNEGAPARLVDARLLVTGAQPRNPVHLVDVPHAVDGPHDVEIDRGRTHLAADLVAQCGPEGPLVPFEGDVVLRLNAGGGTQELSAALPVEQARVALERDCQPLRLSAGLARDPAAAGEVRLTVRVRTRAAARVRTLQDVSYDGRPVAVLGARLPFSAGVPGLDTVTSFGLVVPVGCAGEDRLTAVLDGETMPVPLDPSARVALQDQRAAACR